MATCLCSLGNASVETEKYTALFHSLKITTKQVGWNSNDSNLCFKSVYF